MEGTKKVGGKEKEVRKAGGNPVFCDNKPRSCLGQGQLRQRQREGAEPCLPSPALPLPGTAGCWHQLCSGSKARLIVPALSHTAWSSC